MTRRLVIVMATLLTAVLFLLSACAQSQPTPTPAAKPATAPETKPTATPAAKPAPAQAWPKAIRLTTPAIGTSLAVYGATVAGMIEKNTGVVVTPQPCTGAVEVVQLFARGEAEMCAANTYVTQSIYTGREGYTAATDRVRSLSGAFIAVIHMFVRADSPIKTIADLKGKRCMFLRPGDAPYTEAYQSALKAYGLTEKDVILMPALAPKDQVQALKEGMADAVLQLSAVPNPEFMELDRTIPIRLLPIEPAKQAQILKDVPYDYIFMVKGGTYKGTPVDTPQLALDSWVSIDAKLPNDFAYAAIKGVVEHFADLKAAHAMFKEWKVSDLPTNPMVPYHAGVLKYYKEAGLLTPAMEQKHNELLKLKNQTS